jgi:hypothetical protein
MEYIVIYAEQWMDKKDINHLIYFHWNCREKWLKDKYWYVLFYKGEGKQILMVKVIYTINYSFKKFLGDWGVDRRIMSLLKWILVKHYKNVRFQILTAASMKFSLLGYTAV